MVRARRVRVEEHEQLDDEEGRANQLQDVDGEEGAPSLVGDGEQLGELGDRQVERIAEQHEAGESARAGQDLWKCGCDGSSDAPSRR